MAQVTRSSAQRKVIDFRIPPPVGKCAGPHGESSLAFKKLSRSRWPEVPDEDKSSKELQSVTGHPMEPELHWSHGRRFSSTNQGLSGSDGIVDTRVYLVDRPP